MLIFHLNNQLASRIMSKFKWLIFVTACITSFIISGDRPFDIDFPKWSFDRFFKLMLTASANERASLRHHFEMCRFGRHNPKYEFSHDFIGEFFATVNSLAKDYKNATTFPCINEKKKKKKGSKYKNSGVVRHDSKNYYVIVHGTLRNIRKNEVISSRTSFRRYAISHYLCLITNDSSELTQYVILSLRNNKDEALRNCFRIVKSINNFKATKHYSFLEYIGTGYGQSAT